MRPLFAYFNAAVVPTAVYAASEDWGGVAGVADGRLVERIDRAGRELASAVAARTAAAPAAIRTPTRSRSNSSCAGTSRPTDARHAVDGDRALEEVVDLHHAEDDAHDPGHRPSLSDRGRLGCPSRRTRPLHLETNVTSPAARAFCTQFAPGP